MWQKFLADNAAGGVDIVELSLGISTYAWLCKGHQAAKRRADWGVKIIRSTTAPCDLCPRDERSPVDYVPTSPGSFCPAPGWVADEAPESWAARLTRVKAEERR